MHQEPIKSTPRGLVSWIGWSRARGGEEGPHSRRFSSAQSHSRRLAMTWRSLAASRGHHCRDIASSEARKPVELQKEAERDNDGRTR